MSDDKMFMLMRFQVMAFGMTEVGRAKLSDAYLYAWEDSVYPINHEGAQWHDGYEDQFRVTKDMIEEMAKHLSDLWSAQQTIPSVYDLEDHYDTRGGTTNWDRGGIIGALRYLYLCDTFDAAFWTAIMRWTPSEAHIITREFDRDSDVYFN